MMKAIPMRERHVDTLSTISNAVIWDSVKEAVVKFDMMYAVSGSEGLQAMKSYSDTTLPIEKDDI